MNNSNLSRFHSDDIVQDSVPPPPLDPMESQHGEVQSPYVPTQWRQEMYDYSYRAPVAASQRPQQPRPAYASYLHMVPPNDSNAPLSNLNHAAVAASPKLTVQRKTFEPIVPDFSNLKKAPPKKAPPASATTTTAAAVAKKPAPQDIQWQGPTKVSAFQSFLDYPSFHDDAITIEQLHAKHTAGKLKKDDSCHSSITKYPWDSQSYLRQLGGGADEGTTRSFPTFYSASFHTNSSAGSSLPSIDSITGTAAAGANQKMIAITPNESVPLRDAEETTKAVRQGYITRVTCWVCQQDVFCIADCKATLCPCCRSMSPIEAPAAKAYGLGIGMTRELLTRLQEECSGTASTTATATTTAAAAAAAAATATSRQPRPYGR